MKKKKLRWPTRNLTLCADAERRLAGRGRVLVRASGTEPIVRVMLEGEDTGMISGMADQIVKKIVERHG
jgi:phosphoglucosamine mutase